ncbi:MAG: ParB/RepB/Spo0J family partition protein [Alphaproteobacteria bacterium]
MSEDKKSHLGKGLSDLMGEKTSLSSFSFLSRKGSGAVTYLPVQNISPNPYQPRKHFDEEKMAELTRSVEVKGVLQPILVRRKKNTNNLFEIIAGERRWRAAQAANFMEIPAIIKNFSDQEILEVALIENLQRADMNPIDEAGGFDQLARMFDYSHKQIAKRIGKSRSYVTNLIRLLQLPKDIQRKVQTKEISASHARSLLSIENSEELSAEISKENLSVRDIEKRIKRQKSIKEKIIIQHDFTGKSDLKKDLARVKVAEYEKELKNVFGEQMKSIQTGKNKEISVLFEFSDFTVLANWLEKYKK